MAQAAVLPETAAWDVADTTGWISSTMRLICQAGESGHSAPEVGQVLLMLGSQQHCPREKSRPEGTSATRQRATTAPPWATAPAHTHSGSRPGVPASHGAAFPAVEQAASTRDASRSRARTAGR